MPKNPELEDVRPYLHTRNNLIEDNEIHNVMQILGDGNGIYIRGAGAGNVIRGNYIHHLVSPINGQSGMRTDGGQMDTLFTGNLLYRCNSQGMGNSQPTRKTIKCKPKSKPRKLYMLWCNRSPLTIEKEVTTSKALLDER